MAEDGAASAGTVVLPASVPDPFEPMNRGLWVVNDGLMRGFVKPTARGYRAVVRKPVRKVINNVGRNLTYPDRVLNNLLQRKWTGARDETYR
ncbi:MAG: MlaA family lipoprotein, partial [Limisphaerales bacterium]